MKKLPIFIAMLLYCTCIFAQTTTLTFSGKDANNQFVRLRYVVINNLSKNWQETIYYPDTVLMLGSTDINDFATTNSFNLSQNVPNPFDGTTDFQLTMEETDPVEISVMDMNGKMITCLQCNLESGTHVFRVRLATPQTYLLQVKTSRHNDVVKMVNFGSAGNNHIEYLGVGQVQPITFQMNFGKGQSTHPFDLGDDMMYVGYVVRNGQEYASQSVHQNQYGSEDFTLNFDVMAPSLPTVITDSDIYISSGSAICGGYVMDDGGATIIERGVMWGTSPDMIVPQNHTSDGSGVGTFTSNITDLTPNTTYYVRAYATNSVGMAFGNVKSFTTRMDNFINTDIALIPDNVDCGNGCAYVASMTISEFPSTEIIESEDDILFTRLKMEHSYLGDLYIRLTCPNGQGATILKQRFASSNACSGSAPAYDCGWNLTTGCQFNSYLGNPIVESGGNSCDPAVHPMGIPWNYCWSNNTNRLQESQYASGSGYIYDIANVHNHYVDSSNTIDMTNIYHPDVSFSSLIGCPINGTWSIAIFDWQGGDNGWITDWEIVFHRSSADRFVYTSPASNITFTSATLGGAIFNENDQSVISRGICWDISPNPTISNSSIAMGSGWGVFSGQVTELVKGTAYYARAYAITDEGPVYGNEIYFITLTDTSAVLTTDSIRAITASGATVYATIVSDEGFELTERGVCWSTSQNPDLNDSHTSNGNEIGSYCINLNGLTPNTTYYVRAYATNTLGTSYGNQISFTTAYDLPSVSTTDVSAISYFTAVSGGNVIQDWGLAVTERGICWSTSQNPSVSDNHTVDGSGLGSFVSTMTELALNTVYYVRAYATNALGTAYGAQQSFSTLRNDSYPCIGMETLTDYDGNVYNTVQLGSQCWMKENLRTTHYANGTSIAMANNTSTITPYRYCPGNDISYVNSYGYLYNWAAVMNGSSSGSESTSGIQGLCPTGWHVPSEAEWTILTTYVQSQSQYLCSGSIAKALASTTDWDFVQYLCAVGNNRTTNNATNFSAIPAGSNMSDFYGIGKFAQFWTATQNTESSAYTRRLYYSLDSVDELSASKYIGFSVRCLRN